MQFDPAVASLEHFDAYRSILDFLCREVGARQHISLFLIEIADAGGGGVQLAQIEFLARQVVQERQQASIVELPVAAELEALDQHRRAALFGSP